MGEVVERGDCLDVVCFLQFCEVVRNSCLMFVDWVNLLDGEG